MEEIKKEMQLKQIGVTSFDKGRFFIEVDEKYRPGLTNIEGFSHLQVVWWGHLSDSNEKRNVLVNEKPYKKGPDKLGVFATRSEFRPNPVLITSISVQEIDFDNGRIYTPYIDAEEGTPVLDIKPYHLSERIKECRVPEWCKHWPEWYEDAGSFDWGSEFNF
jgi:tRNA (Thr-GGU) A37 N-methylase